MSTMVVAALRPAPRPRSARASVTPTAARATSATLEQSSLVAPGERDRSRLAVPQSDIRRTGAEPIEIRCRLPQQIVDVGRERDEIFTRRQTRRREAAR